MRNSFYFYDLETSGLNPRADRIMQFAGQRTDLYFRPIGQPANLLVQLADDTLPGPGAIMVTGITPQKTRAEGISERDFCRFIIEEVATPGTTIIGYNSVRFDDEFMRNTLWRNFYDAYEWQWKEQRSRWDLLDVVRMTRALRPEGITWPVTDDGKATNRLELITKLNGISHQHAHDALADVIALIEVTRLIKQKQPQLYDYLYKMRWKRSIKKMINLKDPQPFVYSSGRYSSKFEKTTVAYPFAEAKNGNVLVFDLRYNLDELVAAEKDGTFAEKYGWKHRFTHHDSTNKSKTATLSKSSDNSDQNFNQIDEIQDEKTKTSYRTDYFPIVKTLQYNRCPAVAPIGVLDKNDGWQRIGLTREQIEQNIQALANYPEFPSRMQAQEHSEYPAAADPESSLYSAFIPEDDLILCSAVRNNGAEDLKNFCPNFQDERLPELLLHYKAKYFPEILDEAETESWQKYRAERLNKQVQGFLKELSFFEKGVAKDPNFGVRFGNKTTEECQFLLDELKLWYQSLQDVESGS